MRISINRITEGKFAKKLIAFGNSNAVAKAIAGIIFYAVALIPFYMYLIVRWIAEPTDFWQEFAIIVVCGIVIGWLQVFLLIVATLLFLAVLADEI